MNARLDDPALVAQDAKRLRVLWILLGLIVLVRLASLGLYPLFDKTEARYALIGALMLRTGNWVTPLIDIDVPFWAKPPLSTWSTAISYAVFGLNTFAARLPSFVFVAGTGVLVYLFGTAVRDRAFGLLATVIFASCGLSFYLAGGVMTDPALLFATTLILVAFWRAIGDRSPLWGYLFFVGCAISLLAKGPIGVVLPGLAIGAWVLWHNEWRRIWSHLPWITGTLLTLAIAVPWYVLAERRSPGFLNYFIVGEHFSRFVTTGWGDLYGGARSQPRGIIWVFGFLATLPWSLMLPAALIWQPLRQALFSRQTVYDPWRSYLLFWNLAPLIFFTFPRAPLITYVAMGLPGFALFAAQLMRDTDVERRLWVPATAALIPLGGILALAALQLEPVKARLPAQIEVLAIYERQRSGPQDGLYYFGEKPFSAQFYAHDPVRLAKDAGEMRRILQQGGTPFFAVPAKLYAGLPADLRADLDVVAERNATILARPKRATMSSAPGDRPPPR